MTMLTYPRAPGFKRHGTSESAAKAITPRMTPLQKIVMSHVRESIFGMTPDECAKASGISLLSIRPRFTELGKLGLIVDTGARRVNESGVKAAVWRIA